MLLTFMLYLGYHLLFDQEKALCEPYASNWASQSSYQPPITQKPTAKQKGQIKSLNVTYCENLMPGDLRTPQQFSDQPKRFKQAQ